MRLCYHAHADAEAIATGANLKQPGSNHGAGQRVPRVQRPRMLVLLCLWAIRLRLQTLYLVLQLERSHRGPQPHSLTMAQMAACAWRMEPAVHRCVFPSACEAGWGGQAAWAACLQNGALCARACPAWISGGRQHARELVTCPFCTAS